MVIWFLPLFFVVIRYLLLEGQPISGPELAMLLEILVTAANEGSLAEVRTYVCELAMFE